MIYDKIPLLLEPYQFEALSDFGAYICLIVHERTPRQVTNQQLVLSKWSARVFTAARRNAWLSRKRAGPSRARTLLLELHIVRMLDDELRITSGLHEGHQFVRNTIDRTLQDFYQQTDRWPPMSHPLLDAGEVLPQNI